ncbi:MAG: LCP family protein [Mogibacterium sp.]|nr:LCP family protein [Mogibacterium sp.]
MSYDDWNPDDFLDFDYGDGGSQSQSKDKYNDEYSEYLASRKAEKVQDSPQIKREKPAKKKKKKFSSKPHTTHSPEERAALKQAQQEAYSRYTSNYDKKVNKAKKTKVRKPSVFLTRIYLGILAVFVGSMAVMDVLPLVWLMVLIVFLLFISALVLPKMRRGGKKRATKPLATLACLLLMLVYVTGTAYALGTLSFLSSTSVDNDKHVARITKNPFNVVITGMDVDGNIDEEGRSDVNMVLTVNPNTGQLLMTSIPRDYQVFLSDKDGAMDKLTHTGFYGVQSTTGAEEALLDMTANYYIKVNFSTVEKFIDAVGGVDVYSEYEFEPVKYKGWTVKEGMNHMDGKQALAFARERKAFDSGDNQRIKNQQAVFEAMFKKATSSKTMLLNYNRVLSELKDYVEMSFSSREVRSLVKMQISKNLKWSIYKNTLVGGDDTQPLYGTGGEYAYVMTQDEESINHARELIQAVLEGTPLTKDSEGVVQVQGAESEGEGEDGENEGEGE